MKFNQDPAIIFQKGKYTPAKHVWLRVFYKFNGGNKLIRTNQYSNQLRKDGRKLYRIMLMRLKGFSYQEMANRFGVSACRMNEIYRMEISRYRYHRVTFDIRRYICDPEPMPQSSSPKTPLILVKGMVNS